MRTKFVASIGLGLAMTLAGSSPLLADGLKNCTKLAKAS